MKKYYFASGIRGIVGEHSGNIRGAKAKAQKLAEQLDEEITIFVRSNKEIDCGKNIPANINTGDGMWNIINDYCYYVDKVCPESAETVESVEETTVSETETVEETAEQETELNAEIAEVEAEQTEENNIPHTVNRGRKSKGLNGYEQTVFSKRLKALHENTNEKQADTAANLGVTRQSFNNWLNAVNEPDFATLIKIAKYYNTSVDYLLGLSDIESLDSNIKTSCTTTGLSQAAVEKLALWTSADDRRKLWTDYLSYYITSPDFEKALEYINKAHNCYNGDLNEDVIVKLWQVSRKIEVVTESLIELEEIPKTGYFDTS